MVKTGDVFVSAKGFTYTVTRATDSHVFGKIAQPNGRYANPLRTTQNHFAAIIRVRGLKAK